MKSVEKNNNDNLQLSMTKVMKEFKHGDSLISL